MEKNRDIKLVAIVGMSGSGKSVAVDYLTEKGIPKVYFGGMILKEVERRGLAVTPDNERFVREDVRERFGKDWVVQQVIAEVEDLVAAGQKKIVLDGLYSWTEYKIMKKKYPGEELQVIAVVVDKDLRHKRVGKRPIRPLTPEEIQLRDKTEIENLEKGGPIVAADYYILNNGTIEEMHKRLVEILEEMHFEL
ncbi:AAA family ATPase [Candidatus Saccharibacteria bacterium]|nr:AAA family ATPase [Candidatus Saccharibacteria bacterium]